MSTPLPAVPSKADLVYEHISAEILNGTLEIDRSVAAGACISAHIPREPG